MESNQPKPKNYLVESILALIFCCWPLGIVAVINASKVNSAYDQGNYAEALQKSEEAKKWMRYTVIAGIVVLVAYLIFLFAMGGLAMLGAAAGY